MGNAIRWPSCICLGRYSTFFPAYFLTRKENSLNYIIYVAGSKTGHFEVSVSPLLWQWFAHFLKIVRSSTRNYADHECFLSVSRVIKISLSS